MIALVALQSYASQVAGASTTIACDAPSTFASGVLGYVNFANGQVVPVIHLPAPTCSRLEHLDTGNEIIPADVLVLTHEAEHIATGSQDECLVERAAVANEWSLLKLFKLAAWRAKAILAGAAYVDAHLLPAYRPDAVGAC